MIVEDVCKVAASVEVNAERFHPEISLLTFCEALAFENCSRKFIFSPMNGKENSARRHQVAFFE